MVETEKYNQKNALEYMDGGMNGSIGKWMDVVCIYVCVYIYMYMAVYIETLLYLHLHLCIYINIYMCLSI